MRKRVAATVAGLPGLVGAVVEARTMGGSSFRGTLRSVDDRFLTVEKLSGSTVLVAVRALVAIVAEHSLVPPDLDSESVELPR